MNLFEFIDKQSDGRLVAMGYMAILFLIILSYAIYEIVNLIKNKNE